MKKNLSNVEAEESQIKKVRKESDSNNKESNPQPTKQKPEKLLDTNCADSPPNRLGTAANETKKRAFFGLPDDCYFQKSESGTLEHRYYFKPNPTFRPNQNLNQTDLIFL